MVDPNFSIRRNVALVRKILNVGKEGVAFLCSFLDGDVHQDFSAREYRSGMCACTSTTPGFFIESRNIHGYVSDNFAKGRCGFLLVVVKVPQFADQSLLSRRP